MIKTGLVSVTFRKLTPEEIVNIVLKAGLQGIEWGGDIHVPHGDIQKANAVRRLTEEAGLEVSSYGSYLKLGNTKGTDELEQVLLTGKTLNAPTVRVWAGIKGSQTADDDDWKRISEEACLLCEKAKAYDMTVSFEFHGGTLTDTGESAEKLLSIVKHQQIRSYWQPLSHIAHEERGESLRYVLPWLSNVHVYHWNAGLREPLEKGRPFWKDILESLKKLSAERYALLEFVKDDSIEQFIKDAEVLRQLVQDMPNDKLEVQR